MNPALPQPEPDAPTGDRQPVDGPPADAPAADAPAADALAADCLLANLAALWASDPELAMAIDRLDDAGHLAVEPTRAGPPTARLAGPDGVARYLHSRYDPRREAAQLADAHLRDDHLCYIVFGGGLGYLVDELLRRLPGVGSVALVEPHLPSLARALSLHDWSGDLRDRRLTVITRADTAHLHEQLNPHAMRIIGGTRLVSTPTAEQLAGPLFAEVRQGVADFVAFTRTSVLTLLTNNEATCRNVCNNLSHYVAAPGIGLLKNRFAGHPAVVVSAGPSLAKRLAGLARIADRVVIVVVQTALRPLLEAGIQPHFVTTLDYHEISRRFFQDLPPEPLARVHLVAEPKANCHTIDAFTGAVRRARDADGRPARPMVSLLGNEFAEKLLDAAAPGNGQLTPGATVAHLAFYLAQHLGCDPIAFVGQDLGFSNGTYYTPGTAIHRTWAGELNRFNSLESMEWQRIVRHRRVMRKQTDVFGRPIYVDEQMFSYLQQFEREFAFAPQRIIDATGGGVRKKGAQVMELDAFAEQFADRPIPPKLFDYQQQACWFDSQKIAPAVAAVNARVEQVEQLRQVCVRMLELLARLAELLDSDAAAFNRQLVEVDELRSWVRRHDDVLVLVSQVSQLAEFRRFSADRSLKVHGTEGVEKRRFQLTRDRAYVAAIRDGCERMLTIFRDGLARLEQSAELSAEQSAESSVERSAEAPPSPCPGTSH